MAKPGGKSRIEQPCPFQLGQARQILDRVEAEMAEEAARWCRRSPGGRARAAVPLSLIQPVSSSTSRVPFEVLTPLISSISARVTGW